MTGSRLQIYFNRLTMDLPQLILGILAILVGFIFVGFALQNYIRNKTGSSLAMLGIFSIMMGLWKVTDTRATPILISNKPVLVFYLSVSMLMLGVVPLMRVMAGRFTQKLSLLLDGCSIITIAVCLVQLGLQTFHIADFRESLIVTHLVLGISVCVVAGSFLVEKIRYKRNIQGNTVGKAVIICVTGVAADLIAYYVKGNSSGLIFTLAAFLVYIIFMGITIIRDYREQERKIKEQEEELASTRIAILLSQIQPHFIFNSLSAIETLCKKDADEAAEALDHLSEYLKGSMAGLTEKKKILFEHELHHVQNYLYIEQKRFGNRLGIVYDIREKGFLIPALTVQPMVENAVRHGICQKLEGGCLTIRTYADATNWIIEVEDNGVGFQVEDLEQMGGNHVGVSNVRSRLKMMCDGELEIKSVQGEGTKVRMMIPK